MVFNILPGNLTLFGPHFPTVNLSQGCTEVEHVIVNYGYELAFFAAIGFLVILGFCYDRDYGQPPRPFGLPLYVSPLDFLDYENRWTFVAAFGAMASAIITLFLGIDVSSTIGSTDVNKTVTTYFSTLIIMVRAVEIAVSFYPLFACVMARKSVIVFFVGFVFAALKFGAGLYLALLCANPIPQILPYAILFVEIPSLCCLAWITLILLYRTIRAVCKGHFYRARQPNRLCVYDFQKARVRQLLIPRAVQKPPPEVPDSTWRRIRQKLIDFGHEYFYDRHRLFKYPNRIICTMAVIAFCIYQVSLFCYSVARNIDNFAYDLVYATDLIAQIFALFGIEVPLDRVVETVINMFFYSWVVPGMVVIVIRLWHTVLIFSNYRIHTMTLWRGDHSFIPGTYRGNPGQIVPQILRFGGYQIAYILWAFLLLQLTGFILSLVLCLVVILPMIVGYYGLAQWLCNTILVPSGISLLLFYMCNWISKCLHYTKMPGDAEDYRTVGFKNMNLFALTDFLFFVLNIATGLFSALWRVIMAFLMGLFYLGRMDQCVFFPGFESWDKGYNCYIGLLATEHLIIHPVLRVFVDLVYDKRRRAAKCAIQRGGSVTPEVVDEEHGDLNETSEGSDPNGLKSRRLRQRWLLLYTLVRNPELVEYRRQEPPPEEEAGVNAFTRIVATVQEALEKRFEPTVWKEDAIGADDGGNVVLVATRTPKMTYNREDFANGHLYTGGPVEDLEEINTGYEEEETISKL